jgi:hypothetical protein
MGRHLGQAGGEEGGEAPAHQGGGESCIIINNVATGPKYWLQIAKGAARNSVRQEKSWVYYYFLHKEHRFMQTFCPLI